MAPQRDFLTMPPPSTSYTTFMSLSTGAATSVPLSSMYRTFILAKSSEISLSEMAVPSMARCVMSLSTKLSKYSLRS